MIGYVRTMIEDLILKPQALPAVPVDRRAYLDVESQPLDVEAQQLSVLAVSSQPIAYAQGSLEISHVVDVALQVQHPDPPACSAIRDAIVGDLVLRSLDSFGAMHGAAPDPVTGQYVTSTRFQVSYVPLVPDAPSTEFATLTYTVVTTLDR